MKRKTLSLLLVTSLTLTLFTGCGSKKEATDTTNDITNTPTVEATIEPEATKEPEATTALAQGDYSLEKIEAAGSIDNLTYTNSEIGFSVTVPDSWLVYGSEETFDYILKAAGGTEDQIETLKSQLKTQGITYICYGTDTQTTATGGTDNLLVQCMNASLFGTMSVGDVMKSLASIVVKQYSSLGATCTVTDPVLTTINGQEVYRSSSVAVMSVEGADGTTTEQNVRQEFIAFQKNGTLVYMAISTALEDSAALAQSFVDSLNFQ